MRVPRLLPMSSVLLPSPPAQQMTAQDLIPVRSATRPSLAPTSHTEDIESTKSRRGEPGIVAEAGTTATITRLRARHLR